MGSPESLVRKHIKDLKAYSSARDEFSGAASIFLDANENALGSVTKGQYNRYPDPHHEMLKKRWSEIKEVDPIQIFFGNGSDEPIDLLIRLFCEPGKDQVVILPPTYGMYEVSANINNVALVKVPLTNDFQLDPDELLKEVSTQSKIVFLCSPNNPTGNLLRRNDIRKILDVFPGIVVIDEAYIDFSAEPSWAQELKEYRNLVVLQTLSKAWGMAGIRVGVAMGDPYVIAMLEKIKPPYNLSLPNQQLALEAMNSLELKVQEVDELLTQRDRLEKELTGMKMVSKVFPSDSNFLLVRFEEAKGIFEYLVRNEVIVRDRSSQLHCENSLRITVGTKEENDRLITLLHEYTK